MKSNLVNKCKCSNCHKYQPSNKSENNSSAKISTISVCKSCIVRYLEHSMYCPECEVLLHNSAPLSKLRPDYTKQALLYMLLPHLYYGERDISKFELG